MSEDSLIVLYSAANEAEASLLSDALAEAKVWCEVEKTASPFDGVGGIGDTEVFIRAADADLAAGVLERFLAAQRGRGA